MIFKKKNNKIENFLPLFRLIKNFMELVSPDPKININHNRVVLRVLVLLDLV